MSDIYNYFKSLCAGIGIELTDNEISKFILYKNLLISCNKKINLTAITEERDIILKHFVDSLTASPYITENAKIIDVGTGAGFPGIPLKIINNNIELTLLDSLKKRILFLENIADELKLDNVEILHGRAEDEAKKENRREVYDIAVSRAVAPLNELSEYCLPFVKEGGEFLAMKGANPKEEIREAQNAIMLLGGAVNEVKKLDIEGNKRTLIRIIKIKKTPLAYPRKAGKPSKAPL